MRAISDILSQQEIDRLLNELSSEEGRAEEILKETKEGKVKEYNFRHPKKLARDQLRTIEMIFENYARFVSTSISAQLRTYVEMQVVSVEPLTYEEFTRSLMVPTVLGLGEMEPLSGQFILEINSKIAFSIVDRLFGGLGNAKVENRTFTDIEASTLSQVMIWMFKELPEAWQNVIPDMKVKFNNLESNPLFAQIVPYNDMIILITLSAVINEVEGFINFCLPFMMLEPVVGRLTAQHWYAGIQEQKPEFQEKIKNRLKMTYLPLSVELEPTRISIEDLIGLQKGDVLLLDAKKDQELIIRIGKRAKFRGKVGLKKEQLAAKITAPIEADEEGEQYG